MKKTTNIFVLCWAVLVLIFNVVVFLLPEEIVGVSKSEGTFWVGYVFMTVSFIGQLACGFLAFKNADSKKMFYHIPLVTISFGATIASIVAALLVMIVPFLPMWLGIIICILILGGNFYMVFAAKTSADYVEQVDEKIKGGTLFIKALADDINTLMLQTSDKPAKDSLAKLYDAARYSDPMSSPALSDIEARISDKYAELEIAVDSDNSEKIVEASNKLLVLINSRNQKCKLYKRN